MAGFRLIVLLAGALLAEAGVAASAADTIRIGVSVAATGPAASLGIPQRNTVELLPAQIAGQNIEYFVLDDGTDATRGVANMRKLIEEDKVDAVIGSSATPASAAMSTVAAEKGVPLVALAASASLILPMTPEKRWVFKAPQNDSLMADAIAADMAKRGVKTLAFIGFNDGYGDGWLAETERAARAQNIRLVAVERYARPDTSVTGQALKIIAAKPDAVLIGGAGTPAALPQKTLKERGYKGLYYQTHGAANADFLRVGGRDVEGTFLPAGPVVVAAQLPDGNPIKPVALDYIRRYEAAHGPGSATSFGAHAYDAFLMLQAAIPAALQHGRPGTAEFRAALRDALEHERELVLTHGIANTSAQDHNGFDARARVMVTIQDGTWKLLP
jgi:branched-chain amino acid transport system substrate-binding protein